jgi:energy-coupling factor transporter transmembrane protein EcfT
MERVGIGRRGGASPGAEQLGRQQVKRFSPYGYLLFTIWGLVLALIADGWRLVALVVLECVFGLVSNPEGLRPLRRFRFWIFILTAVAAGPLVAGGSGLTGDGMITSWVGASSLFMAGLSMAGRALALTLSFSLGLSALSLSDVVAMFDGLHLRGLGFALGLAMNLFTTLQEMATVTFQTIRLRGGLRRPLVALRLFMITLLSNTMRYGDQVVNAASVRAFDPNSDRYSPAYPEGLLQTADLGLFLALVVCGILLLVLGR